MIAEKKVWWAIGKAYTFDSLTVSGIPLCPSPGGPSRFIPLFDTMEDAIKFAPTETHLIRKVEQCD